MKLFAVLVLISASAGYSPAQPLLGAKPAGAGGTLAEALKDTVPSGYHIGLGDVLQVDVWKEPDVSVPLAVVRSDGVITVPMIKEITVAGMTPRELEGVLSKRLAEFIHNPDVTVVVKESHSEKAYIVGAVKKEGQVLLQNAMTVLQAIAESGGLTDYAKRSKIYVLRQENSRQVRIPFDYQAVIKGQRTESNIILRSGDTVVVPE